MTTSLFPPLLDSQKPRVRRKRRLPFVPRQADIEALIAAAETPRDRLLLQFGVLTGLRVAEICALDLADVDLLECRVRVRHGKGDKERIVPIPGRLIEPLREWVNSLVTRHSSLVTQPLFPSPRGGPLTTRAVQKLIKRLAVKAGLPEAGASKRYTPHKLRHRYATNVYRKTRDIRIVQELLGHESIATTEIYTHVEDDLRQEAVRDL